MNIFVVDRDPVIAGSILHDAHTVKMSLESAQMACTVAIELGGSATYKPTHRHHPCVLWIGRSRSNAAWFFSHGSSLFSEYEARYGRTHKSRSVFLQAMDHVLCKAPVGPLTPFEQVMPEQYNDECTVTAYRNYYVNEKASGKTWKRNQPKWIINALLTTSKKRT